MKRIFFLLVFACLYVGVNGQVTYLDSSFNATGILALNHAGGVDVPAVSLTRPNGKSLMIGYSYFDTRVPSSTLTTATVVQFDLSGKPDSTFGQNGIVVLDQLKTDADAADAVLQPDGKLLITGKYLNSTAGPHHFVVRLNEDGSLDGSFGVNGVAGHPDVALVAWGSSVALQMDGKIVMGGTRFIYDGPLSSGLYKLTLIRFLPNGLVDTSFGENGVVLSDFPTKSEALAIAFDADNKLCVGGSINYDHSLLARYLPNGVLDSSFGVGGVVQLPWNGGVSHVLIQPNGQIIVAGVRAESSYFSDPFVRRCNYDGSIDPSFENIGMSGNTLLAGLTVSPQGIIWVGLYDPLELKVFRYLPDGKIEGSFSVSIPPQDPYILFYAGLSLQSDGSIMVGGTHPNDFGFRDYALLRLNESIALDSTYGNNGFVIQNASSGYMGASSILMDDNGQIVVGGDATNTDATSIINSLTENKVGFVSRFNQNGTRDNTFSSDGVRALPIGVALFNRITKQSDGKIIAAGNSYGSSNGAFFGAVRLLSDGTDDPSFGSSGMALYFFDQSIYNASVCAVAISPDKAVIVIGKVTGAGNKSYLALLKFNQNGFPNSLFGNQGLALTDLITGNIELNAGIVQSDGKILVAGTYSNPVPNIFLVRFLSNGVLDNSFGTNGVVLKPFTGVNYRPTGLAQQSDGKIVLCGNQGGINVLVGRLNPDGTKDLTFSEDGLVLINTGSGESGNAMALQSDGKVVIAGWNASSSSAVQADPMVMRLLPTGVLDSSFAGTGYVITNLPGANQLNALAIQSDGSYITAGYSNNDYLLIRYLSKLNVGLLAEPSFESELLVYPNPVRGQVALAYTLSTQSNVSVELFDMQGKRCQSFLLNENRPQGEQTEYLNFAKNLTPGVYTLRIEAEKGSRSVQVLIVE